MPATLTTWRHSSFYLFYFATLGVMLPYWSLYLQSLGFAPPQIGVLLAITMATKLVAPYVWGWIVDHRGHRMMIIRVACFATCACFAGIYIVGASFIGLVGVMLLFSFFWNAALPQFEATTLDHLADNAHRYSIVRVWGSIGFIATAIVMGIAIQPLGISAIPATLLILFAALWMTSMVIPEQEALEPPADRGPILRVVAQPRVVGLLIICFLVQASHGPYYAFFSIYLEELGHTGTAIGLLWGLGVFAEVLMFLAVPKLLLRFGARRLMMMTLALSSCRWLIIGHLANHAVLLLLAQVLHAFSFGLYHAVAIYLIHRFFTGAHQGRGQALYSSLSFGAGGALGYLAAGFLWAGWGAEGTYTVAAGLSAVGLAVAWRWLQTDHP